MTDAFKAAVAVLRKRRLAEPFGASPGDAPILRSAAARYAIAAAAVVMAAAAHRGLAHAFGPLPPFLMFYPAVLIVSLIAGGGPGILATILSALLADYLLIPPIGSFAVATSLELIALSVFVGTSVVLCALAERMRGVKWAQTVARRQMELLSVTMASIREGVIATDIEGRVIFLNDAAENLIGCKRADVERRPLASVFKIANAVSKEPLPDVVEGVLRSGSWVSDGSDIELLAGNGKALPVEVSGVPIRSDDGNVCGAVLTFRDRSERKRVEDALREADRRKNVFLATLSHELRNPLAPIRTAARLLESARVSQADLERCRSIISRQVAQMASLLDDLLDISRLTRGELTLKKEYVPLQQVLDAAVEAVQPFINLKQHRLRMDLPPSLPVLEVDPVRLTQVISNLLTNAAKYTDPGGEITLGCRPEADSLAIFVRDNGIGLAPEMFSRVFDMFAQVEPTKERSEGGLGIGLALVKALVELHGGDIEVRSAGREQGTTFTVMLPRSAIAPEPARTISSDRDARAGPSRCVLIADDNPDGAEILGMLLQSSGHTVHVANDGAAALELAARIKPDIAVLDIGMPGLSGYEVAKRIRCEAWGVRMTLIAVTGWGQEEDKREALAVGFDFHVTKPMDPTQLEAIFASIA
jgi:PAS domain S-box-containing protein